MRKTAQMRVIEYERGKPLETILAEGVAAGKSWDDLALDLEVSRLTLRDWVRRMGGELIVERRVSFNKSGAAAD